MSVDLEQLKARLAKLGVHIQDPPACQDQAAQRWERLEESNVKRHNQNLAHLLGRCARVQHVIGGSDDGRSQGDSDESTGMEPAAAGAQTTAEASRQRPSSRSHRASRAMQPTAAGPLKPPDSRGASAAQAAGGSSSDAAAAEADSKLLMRAAQRLLEDAQEDAQQVSRNLKAAAAAAGGAGVGRRAAGRATSRPLASSSCARKSAAATVAAAASVDDLRNSPLGTVLAQYKEAQAAWGQEKAKLRREAVAARKEASQARLELTKASRSSEHRAQEASSLKAALKGRDVLLEELQGRVRQLEDELARCQEVAAERLVSVSRERDDLQALLLATLERLEGVEAVVAAADATSAAMEDKVRVLEAERLAALQAAATARQEVAQLQEARRRLEWQSQLLDKMSKVQLQHNKRKSEALRELLASTEAAPVVQGSTSRARASCNQASAALQDLLDELLTSNSEAAEGQQS